MRILFVYLIFIFLMITMTPQILAVNIYYVDATNGDDSDTGTSPEHAWKTISKVNSSSFNSGESIYFKRRGEWKETLIISSSGSSGNPITFGAYGIGANPIINGADLVTAWTQYDANIWQATCNTEPTQVFFDRTICTKESAVINLDSANEWYWSYNTLYVSSTNDPDTAYTNPGVEASQRHRCVYVPGAKNIIIRDLKLTKGNSAIGGGIFGESGAQVEIRSCQFDNFYGSAIHYYDGDIDSRIWLVTKNSINNCGGNGIAMSTHAKGWIVSQNVITNVGQLSGTEEHDYVAAIKITGNGGNHTIENNTIDGGGNDVSIQSATGIWFDTIPGENSSIIRYNLVKNMNKNGIMIEVSSDHEVYYNIVCDNNGYGIFIYRGSNDNKVFNNIAYNNKYGIGVIGNYPEQSDDMMNNLIKNNIAYNNNIHQLRVAFGGENDGTYGSGNVYEYNCFGAESSNFIEWGFDIYKSTYDAWETSYGSSTYSVESDPLMTDPDNDDLTLQSTSLCINAGTNVSLTSDYAGNAVPYGCCADIGAFEFIGTPNLLSTEIIADPTSGATPLTVNFTGNATGGSSPYSYSWDFGDGESSSEQNPSHTYNAEGNYTVNLTVTDSNNSQASDSVIITATAPSDPLSVSFSASPTSGQVPLAVSFSAGANGGTSPYSYNWDFGDENSSSEQNPSHTYNQAGTYDVILTVTDSESSQASDSLTVEVSSNPTFNLTISSVTGSPAPGTGGTTDPDPGSHSYSQGTSVQMKAIPESDYRFSKWSGDVSSSDTYDKEISINMDNDKSISAYFFTKCGDVNGDLSITAADAQRAFDIYLGRIADPTESEKENADVTCDGTATLPNITPADANAIFEKFIGRNELPCDCSCKSRTASYQVQTSEVHDVAIFVDSISYNESNEIIVPVAVDKPFDIHTFGFDLVYPSEVLEFVAMEESEEIKDDFMVDANEIADGVIRAGGYRKSFNLVPNPRTLIKLIFRVIEEEKGTISFNIINTVDDIKNASFRSRRIEEKKISYRR